MSRRWPGLKALLNKAARSGIATCITADLEQTKADYKQLQYEHAALLEVKTEMEKVLNGSQAECFRLSQEMMKLKKEVQRLRALVESYRQERDVWYDKFRWLEVNDAPDY